MEKTIGVVVVSGVAAAASGASGRDAVMRSAVSVITVYFYNEMGESARNQIAREIVKDAQERARQLLSWQSVKDWRAVRNAYPSLNNVSDANMSLA